MRCRHDTDKINTGGEVKKRATSGGAAEESKGESCQGQKGDEDPASEGAKPP